MIKKITIENFRGIEQSELADFGKLNVFIGPNGCGKTTVLLACASVCDVNLKGDIVGLSLESMIDILYGETITKRNLFYSDSGTEMEIQESSWGKSKISAQIPHFHKQPNQFAFAIIPFSLKLGSPYDFFSNPEIKLWDFITDIGAYDKLAEWFSTMIGEPVDCITYIPSNNQNIGNVKILSKKRNARLAVDRMASGWKHSFRIMMLLTALSHKSEDKTSYFFWDEPELHQHPSSLRNLIRSTFTIFGDTKIQSFIATQSAEALAIMLEEAVKSKIDGAVYQLKLDDGKLEYNRIAFKNAQELLKGGIDLRKLEELGW